jgi:hypothetical protein
MGREKDCYHGGTRTPGQIHPVICGQIKHDSATEQMLDNSESYLRAENSIKNMQIMMHPEKYENPAWQISVNNTGTENVIRMNKKYCEENNILEKHQKC